MTRYAEMPLGELFDAVNGSPKYIKDYMDRRPGPYPVYSASLTMPFGYVDGFDFNGHFLTWVMNGYGGRVQEVSGQFSANRDRGVLVPRAGVEVPDLTYLRHMIEPQLIMAAVGRRVDGRQNEYTKIYPATAKGVLIQLPLNRSGQYDYAKMSEIGAKFRRIEAAQADVRSAQDPLRRALFPMNVPIPSIALSIGDERFFSLSIGKRVLRVEHTATGIPVYSANALIPFGTVSASNLTDFTNPSLLWGIDGNFDWNLIPAGEIFATTDHCGRLQILDERIDPEYVYWFLRSTRGRYGFDRVYRASLQNMRAEVTVTLPVDPKNDKFSIEKQRLLVGAISKLERNRAESLAALEDILKARITVEL